MTENRGRAEILRSSTVAILGGGPAGQAVARLLKTRGVTPIVLERDTGPKVGVQGGSLDLTEHGGLRAIRAMELDDQFLAVARPEGQTFCILDTSATVHLDLRPTDFRSARPEVDRIQLRRLLHDSITTGSVRWGRKVIAVNALPTGQYRIETADHQAVGADVIIACDGIGSRASALVTAAKPVYCGITFCRHKSPILSSRPSSPTTWGTARCLPWATTKRSWDSATATDRSVYMSLCAHQRTR
jgi:2-polyprenyl-6-methoxyphenol hydroxylase-like FAD-dependent oxidoreductase